MKFFSSTKYSFWSDERGKCCSSTVPRRGKFPKRMELSLPSKSLNGLMVNGIP